MDYSQLDDGELLEQIKAANNEALDELYGRYGRLVYSVAISIIQEQGAAEEITLDTFTKVWQKAGMYQSNRGSVRVWLTSMTRNRAIDVLRRQDTLLNYQRKIWAQRNHETNQVERIPEKMVDLQLRQEKIRQAIHKLSEEQRDVLSLAYFQGYTQSQIAHIRDMPLGTVKTRIRSAMIKLRQMLEEEIV